MIQRMQTQVSMINQYLKLNNLISMNIKYIFPVLGLLLIPATTHAVGLNVTGDVGVSVGSSTRAEVRAQVEADLVPRIKDRADTEIDRRIAALDTVSERIGEMKNVSAEQKASLTANIQLQKTTLIDLKTKIDAETDVAGLRTDAKSITSSYRIFALIIPQGHIIAAADRVDTIVTNMTSIGTKLQARITAAQTAGKDVTALQTLLVDFNAKVADAKVQADASQVLIAGLTPDAGDQAKFDANKKTLLDAQAKVKLSVSDLKAARKDAEDILTAIRAFHIDASATTTASSTI